MIFSTSIFSIHPFLLLLLFYLLSSSLHIIFFLLFFLIQFHFSTFLWSPYPYIVFSSFNLSFHRIHSPFPLLFFLLHLPYTPMGSLHLFLVSINTISIPPSLPSLFSSLPLSSSIHSFSSLFILFSSITVHHTDYSFPPLSFLFPSSLLSSSSLLYCTLSPSLLRTVHYSVYSFFIFLQLTSKSFVKIFFPFW